MTQAAHKRVSRYWTAEEVVKDARRSFLRVLSRLSLRKDALQQIRISKEVEELFALTPNQMGMEEHRLKFFYLKNLPDMRLPQAWLKAKQQVAAEARQARVLPVVDRATKAKIQLGSPETRQ